MLVEIVLTAAQLYEKSHSKRLAIYISSFTVYMTAFDTQAFFSFDTTVEATDHTYLSSHM